jgi:hypothetical protein
MSLARWKGLSQANLYSKNNNFVEGRHKYQERLWIDYQWKLKFSFQLLNFGSILSTPTININNRMHIILKITVHYIPVSECISRRTALYSSNIPNSHCHSNIPNSHCHSKSSSEFIGIIEIISFVEY